MADIERGLASISMVIVGGALWFFLLWTWFDFWRRHRLVTYGVAAASFLIAVMLVRTFPGWVYAGKVDMPVAVKALGWAVLAVTTVFASVADRQIGWRVRTFTPFFDERGRIELRTTGAYGVVRHPIYAAAIWFQLGTFFISGYPGTLVACAIWSGAAVWFTRQEEGHLTELLEDPRSYDRYRERVPALFPKLRRP